MLFAYLKYIKPLWYYNLASEKQVIPYFVDYRNLSKSEQDLLIIDDDYQTLEGKLADAAYQSWQKGIMRIEPDNALRASFQVKRPTKQRAVKLFEDHSLTIINEIFAEDINDNYRFIRRFFHPAVLWYILLVRLLSFQNPIREFSGFFRSLKARRVDIYKNNSWSLLQNDYDSYESQLISQQPKVSVIIPTLNRYNYLKDVLNDLEKQVYKNFEVIIYDQSDKFEEEFYNNWNLVLRVIRQEEKALCKARNDAMTESKGDYILLFDDDSRVERDWILQHLKCLNYFDADVSSGISLSIDSDMIPKNYSYFRWSDQLDSGNVMFRKDILHHSGMFDRQFEGQTNEDAEFGLRFYLLGFKAVSNPLARRIHLKASQGGMREMSGWDSFRPKNILDPRPVPSLLYLSRKYFGNHLSRLMLLFTIPGTVIPYKYKSKNWPKIAASISSIIIWPLILLQVILSWSKATEKLTAGSLIEKLED